MVYPTLPKKKSTKTDQGKLCRPFLQDEGQSTPQNVEETVQAEPQVEAHTNLAQDVSSSSTSSTTAKGTMLEFCAGSAMLSKCFHEQGFTVMAVDHQQNRFHPVSKICNLSLTLQSSWKYFHWLVVAFTVLFCHAAPPCGTMLSSSRVSWWSATATT